VTAQCWLHPEGEEHDVTLLVGVRRDDGQVEPADLRCARAFPDEDMLPATEINVEVVRS
jgi:hypothetical protein